MTSVLAVPLATDTPCPDTDDRDDAPLVARALRGDHQAEAMIYRRHARFIGNLAARLCGARADAEDITQDTFAQALEHLHELRDPSALKPWLARIAVRQAQRRLRRRRLLRWLGLEGPHPDRGLDTLAATDSSPECREALGQIEAVLSRRPAGERVAWTLHRVEGETLEAVAEVCGCSLATVKRRVAAVEARLDRTLERSPRLEAPR
ncbi:MAG: RNA polymerase sigma factor [Deltaproteobacteria bacterium]|nr:RNA polymerase sigma factor [Deltaproteobacteria bacterium]